MLKLTSSAPIVILAFVAAACGSPDPAPSPAPASTSTPAPGDMPTGPILYDMPTGPIAYGLPSCSSPPASAVGCKSDAACDDSNPCTADTCEQGSCAYRFVAIGAACGPTATCDETGCCSAE